MATDLSIGISIRNLTKIYSQVRRVHTDTHTYVGTSVHMHTFTCMQTHTCFHRYRMHTHMHTEIDKLSYFN